MEEARPSPLVSLVLALALAMLLALNACSTGPRVRFVAEDRTYTLTEVDKMAPGVAAGASAKVSGSDAASVRQRILSRLRGQGQLASEAADFMTSEFPSVTQSVPYYVESAKVDGHSCWIILESWGGRTGDLGFRRLWVFDRETGGVLDSRTYR